MLLTFFEGPKERWQVDLESLNKDGLIYLSGRLIERERTFFNLSRKEIRESVLSAKKVGKSIARMKSVDRFLVNPQKAVAEKLRRRAAAQKSARRRKKESRKGTTR